MERVEHPGERPAEYDVFLSYASEDRAWCERLAECLRAQGIRVWVDFWELQPGDHLEARLNEGLERSRRLVTLFSRSYFRHDKCWTLAESYSKQHADVLARDRLLIPLLIEDCTVKPTLASLIYVDFRHPVDFEARFRQLVQALDDPSRESVALRPTADLSRDLAGTLEAAFKELERRQLAGLPNEDTRAQILELKRQLRAGGQLHQGDVLGDRYRLAEQVGVGSFGTVWKAYDRSRSRLVAIKVLHGEKTRDASQVERFFRGAAKMAELSHSAIVRIVEARREDDFFHYYVMEYLGGGDLRAAIRARRIPRAAVIPLICEIGAGLQYAHDAGLVHRDVKPANVLLDSTGRAKLTDFDLVRAADTTGGTRTGMLGTFVYAAPECLDQAKDAGPAADIYSLGMTTVFALHGNDLPGEAFRRPDAFISKLSCARSLKWVLQRAVEEEPWKRFDSCQAFCDALQRAVSSVPDDAASPIPATSITSSSSAGEPPSQATEAPTEAVSLAAKSGATEEVGSEEGKVENRKPSMLPEAPAARGVDWSGEHNTSETNLAEEITQQVVEPRAPAYSQSSGQTPFIIIDAIEEATIRKERRRARRTLVRIVSTVAAGMVLLTSGLGVVIYWQRSQLSALMQNKYELDVEILAIQQEMGRETDEVRLAELELKLQSLNNRAESALKALGKSSVEYSEDELDREIHAVLRKFDADTYVVHPILKERVRFHIDWLVTRKTWPPSQQRWVKYWPIIRRAFRAEEVPEELGYIAYVESQFDAEANNDKVGARGMWQFIPAIARKYGLRVESDRVDDRINPEKGAVAAAKYLDDLLSEFGEQSFLLVLASYNKGEDGVRKVLNKVAKDPGGYEKRDFWHLYRMKLLPEETREYVPAVIAAAIVFGNPLHYGGPILPEDAGQAGGVQTSGEKR